MKFEKEGEYNFQLLNYFNMYAAFVQMRSIINLTSIGNLDADFFEKEAEAIWVHIPKNVVSLTFEENFKLSRPQIDPSVNNESEIHWSQEDLDRYGHNIAEMLHLEWKPIFSE